MEWIIYVVVGFMLLGLGLAGLFALAMVYIALFGDIIERIARAEKSRRMWRK